MRATTLVLITGLLLSPGLFANQESEGLSMFERIARNNLGRDVAFNFKPRMLGMTGVRLNNFRIAENADYLSRHPYLEPWAFSAASVDIRYNPLAFFIGRISLHEIIVDYPEVQIAINSRLQNNFEDILEKQKKNRFSNWIRAHHIDIRNMHFKIYSELMFRQPVTYEVQDIDVEIENVIKGKTASVDIAAKTPGSVKQNVNINGTIGPILSIGRIEESPMDLQFRVNYAPMEFELAKVPESIFKDRRYRRTLALPESGFANLSYDFKGDVWKQLNVTGVARLDDIVMASIDKSLKGKPFNIVFNSESIVSLDKQISQIENISLSLNKSSINLSGEIRQIIDNPEVDIQLHSNNIDLVEMDQIYPFISDIYQIGLADGITTISLQTSGNLKKGLALEGSLETRNLQLKSLKNGRKGARLNSSVELGKPITYLASENRVSYPELNINIANSRITIAGVIEEVTSLDRKIDAIISSKALDVSAMHKFFPYIDDYLPEELSYKGSLAFNTRAKGNLYHGEIEGKADLSEVIFRIKNFARKPSKSPFDIDYSLSFDDERKLALNSSFLLRNGELDNSVVFVDGLKFLLGDKASSAKGKAYLNAINPEAIAFKKASGKLSLASSDKIDIELAVKGISNSKQKSVDLSLAGLIDSNDFKLNLDGQLEIPRADYQQIVEINPDARRFLSEDHSFLILPLKITGSISEPRFQAST